MAARKKSEKFKEIRRRKDPLERSRLWKLLNSWMSVSSISRETREPSGKKEKTRSRRMTNVNLEKDGRVAAGGGPRSSYPHNTKLYQNCLITFNLWIKMEPDIMP